MWLAARYNRPGFEIFYYNIYAVCGDGCMMEGTGSEAASLAGHLGLDNLCWVYDNNHITIEGNTRIAFTEDVATRFEPDRVVAAAKDLLSRTKGKPQVPNPAASELASANPLAPPRRHDGSDGRFPPPKLFLVNYLRATSPLPCLAQRLLLNRHYSKAWPSGSRQRGDQMKRRNVIKQIAASAPAIGAVSHAFEPQTLGSERSPTSLPHAESNDPFWPDGARLVVSISMQFEAGAQADRGAESPFPKINSKYPDLPAAKWYEYGFKEGIPRLQDLFNRRRVKVTSHMVH